MQVNIQGLEHDLRQIEQIDSRLYNNKDTQLVIQELHKKCKVHERTTASQTLLLQNGFTDYIKLKTRLYF